jgi:hypothetical protein
MFFELAKQICQFSLIENQFVIIFRFEKFETYIRPERLMHRDDGFVGRFELLDELVNRNLASEWTTKQLILNAQKEQETHEYPDYLSRMFEKGDFDVEDISEAAENEVNRYSCLDFRRFA